MCLSQQHPFVSRAEKVTDPLLLACLLLLPDKHTGRLTFDEQEREEDACVSEVQRGACGADDSKVNGV